ncbi:MAG TPA: VWA domain-containing protein [Nitrospiria bacterium]|nr:VWA domain-containing protein [Nitrospiria bacterium]
MQNPSPEYLEKLQQVSPKAARAYERVEEELIHEVPPDQFQAWFTLGSLIAYGSSANGIKYFNDSMDIMRAIKKAPGLSGHLRTGIQLAMENNNMALEYFRALPALAGKFPSEHLAEWAQTGNRLAGEDYLTGTEYFKAGPAILPHLDISLMQPWGKIGLLLSKEDIRAKSFHAIEFFRTTPQVFSLIKESGFHPVFLKIGHSLAMQNPGEANLFFQTIPQVFEQFREREGLHLIFLLAAEISFEAPAAVNEFLKQATDILKMVGENLTAFKTFVDEGLKLKERPPALKAFFSLKSERALDVLKTLTATVFLSDVNKRLKYFAEMVREGPVDIKPGPVPGSRLDGRRGIITVPEKLGVYASREENLRLYKFLVLHEAAHLEFGSYLPLSEDSRQILEKGGHQEIWDNFPDRVLARNLWLIAEESRIDYFIRARYPGAMRELTPLLDGRRENRPDLFNLSGGKCALEALFQLSFHDDITVPLPVADVVSRAFSILKRLWRSDAAIDDTFRTVIDLYGELSPLFTPEERNVSDIEPVKPDARVANYGTIPESSFSHHGVVTPELAFQTDAGSSPVSDGPEREEEGSFGQQPEEVALKSRDPNAKENAIPGPAPSEKHRFLYPEWDWMSREYKPDWCTLVEKEAEPAASLSGKDIPSHGALLSIRRYFEKFRPENLQKTRREKEGDEIDLDGLIDTLLDLRAGISPPERFYIKREKRERKVTVAFLIDLSGSTRQVIGEDNRRIIDLEKEGLIMLGEALDAIGDEYGIFGFSGQSRNQVEFYTVKDFNEHNPARFNLKIAGLEPMKQNRDGAAIRHVSRKLAKREAKIRLLMVVSDGKPLDDDYTDLYALEDTRMALREARNSGIHPFCITVDREASHYIRKMYQDIHYTHISDIRTLPQKLPQIYKKLTT